MALARVRAGEIPRTPAHDVFGGHGRNNLCDVCFEQISNSQMGYEIATEHLPSNYHAPLFLHIKCYDAWVVACAELQHNGGE